MAGRAAIYTENPCSAPPYSSAADTTSTGRRPGTLAIPQVSIFTATVVLAAVAEYRPAHVARVDRDSDGFPSCARNVVIAPPVVGAVLIDPVPMPGSLLKPMLVQ
jgi:hypothetical protein